MSEPQVAHEPFDRLTGYCDNMTDLLDVLVAADQAKDPEVKDVKAIVFLMDGEMGGIQTHGYENAAEATVDLFIHLKAIFRSRGQDLQVVALP